MLQDCLVESRISAKTKKPFTVIVSVVTHCIIVVGLILVPLFQEQVLPQIRNIEQLQPPVTRAVQLVPVERRGSSRSVPQKPTEFIAPTVIPSNIAVVIDERVDNGFAQGTATGIGLNPLLDSIAGLEQEPFRATPPPPPPPRPAVVATPPPAPPAPTPVQIRRGGDVVRSNLIHQVTPVYPQLARQTRVDGDVVLEAVITRDGTVDSLRVVSGHLLLVKAAAEAVQQWRYRPTLLNGEPVEVITNVTVSFRLN